MKYDILDEIIRVYFYEHIIIIGIFTGRIYYNGNRILTTDTIHEYRDDLRKPENSFWKHREFLKLVGEHTTLKATIGRDGRVFFNEYDNKNITKFRNPPIQTYSFHKHNRDKMSFYVDDLKKPVMAQTL